MLFSSPKPSLPNGRSQWFVVVALTANLPSDTIVIDQASALSPWSAVNGANITVIAETVPVSSALPNALSVTIPSGTSGSVGVANSGYFGEIPIFHSNVYWLKHSVDRYQSEFQRHIRCILFLPLPYRLVVQRTSNPFITRCYGCDLGCY